MQMSCASNFAYWDSTNDIAVGLHRTERCSLVTVIKSFDCIAGIWMLRKKHSARLSRSFNRNLESREAKRNASYSLMTCTRDGYRLPAFSERRRQFVPRMHAWLSVFIGHTTN